MFDKGAFEMFTRYDKHFYGVELIFSAAEYAKT
jgi:hypothetical protein